MSDNWASLGPLYGKLGLATSAEIISARKTAAQAGYDEFRQEHLPSMLRAALGTGPINKADPLFNAMREADPTLDLEPTDREAQLLAGAVLSAEMKSKSILGGMAALGVVTASFGGVRQCDVMPQLVRDAEQALADLQFQSDGKFSNVAAAKRPDDVEAAVEAVTLVQTNYGHMVPSPSIVAALKKVADYSESAHKAAARQANTAIAYTRKLEEELRTYWWVVGGWSDHLRKPFRDLSRSEAALRAGTELAGKTSLPLGLFAAPALIDMVVRLDRKGRPTKPALADAVRGLDPIWRLRFKQSAVDFGDLLPVTLALHLSGECSDADDWQPRFKRTTGASAHTPMDALDIALQLYREIILARALASANQ